MLRLIINLDNSPQRLSWMLREFKRLELDFLRVSAVDRKKLSELKAMKISRPRSDGEPWSYGDVACFLSHRRCWKIAARSDQNHTAIFEDDVHLARNSARFLDNPSWIPNEVDIVKLETNFTKTVLGRKAARDGDYSLSEIKARHRGAAGYIVTRSAAERLLEDSRSFDRTVDDFLFDPWGSHKRFNCYQLNPAICLQDSVLRGRDANLPSIIDSDRKLAQSPPEPRRGIAKLKRELKRPFERLAAQAVRIGRLTLHGESIVEIPYEFRGNTSRSIRRRQMSEDR